MNISNITRTRETIIGTREYLPELCKPMSNTVISTQCLEAPWTTMQNGVQQRFTVCSRIHCGAVPIIRNQVSLVHCLSPTDRWTNGAS
jgi:hypothetical protein